MHPVPTLRLTILDPRAEGMLEGGGCRRKVVLDRRLIWAAIAIGPSSPLGTTSNGDVLQRWRRSDSAVVERSRHTMAER